MIDDVNRCGRFGIEYLVIHPGSSSDAEKGVHFIADALNEIIAGAVASCHPQTQRSEVWGCFADNTPKQTTLEGGTKVQAASHPKILLETTAGPGNNLCWRFEEIAAVLELLERKNRFGVCLDSCHVFTAGYDIRTSQAYRKTMADFDKIIGLKNLLAIHLNDSKANFGSRIDRHQHIGKGKIGLDAFACFVNDKRLTDIPMILETPKGLDKQGQDYDLLNFRQLLSLARNRA